jgi:predicted transcriptional regulator
MTLGKQSLATRKHVSLNDWQICEIKTALGEADRGEFVTPQELHRSIRKWTRRATQPLQRRKKRPSTGLGCQGTGT